MRSSKIVSHNATGTETPMEEFVGSIMRKKMSTTREDQNVAFNSFLMLLGRHPSCLLSVSSLLLFPHFQHSRTSQSRNCRFQASTVEGAGAMHIAQYVCAKFTFIIVITNRAHRTYWRSKIVHFNRILFWWKLFLVTRDLIILREMARGGVALVFYFFSIYFYWFFCGIFTIHCCFGLPQVQE